MKIYLNASAPNFGWLKNRFTEFGLRGVRLAWFTVPDSMQELAEWVKTRPFTEYIYLLGGEDSGETAQEILDEAILVCAAAKTYGVQSHVKIEFPAEANLKDAFHGAWPDKPKELGEACRTAVYACEDYGIEFMGPAVSGLALADLEYAKIVQAEMPQEVSFAIHRYNGSHLTKPYKAWGFEYASREAEMATIRQLAQGRKIYITETGLSEGPYKKRKPFPRCLSKETYWVDEQTVADEMVSDVNFWAAQGDVEGVAYYQLNDGPSPDDPEDHFGWRYWGHPGDEWKPVARAMPPEIKRIDPVPPPPPPPPDEGHMKYYRLSVAEDIINDVQVDSRSDMYIGMWTSVRNFNYAAANCPDGIESTFGMSPQEMHAFARVGNNLLMEWRNHWLKNFQREHPDYPGRCKVRKEYWRPFAELLRKHRAEVGRLTDIAQASPERELCAFDNIAGWCVCRERHGITG